MNVRDAVATVMQIYLVIILLVGILGWLLGWNDHHAVHPLPSDSESTRNEVDLEKGREPPMHPSKYGASFASDLKRVEELLARKKRKDERFRRMGNQQKQRSVAPVPGEIDDSVKELLAMQSAFNHGQNEGPLVQRPSWIEPKSTPDMPGLDEDKTFALDSIRAMRLKLAELEAQDTGEDSDDEKLQGPLKSFEVIDMHDSDFS